MTPQELQNRPNPIGFRGGIEAKYRVCSQPEGHEECCFKIVERDRGGKQKRKIVTKHRLASLSSFRAPVLSACRESICEMSLPALLQNALSEVVAHPCAVLERLQIRGLQQLLLAVVQRLMNGLLHARIVQLALAGRLALQ